MAPRAEEVCPTAAYTELVKVPLALVHNDVGGSVSGPVELADVPTTLLSMAGIEAPEEYLGSDILDAARDESAFDDGVAISVSTDPSTAIAARDERYTYLREEETETLYDRDADPGEQSPIQPGDPAWEDDRADRLAAVCDGLPLSDAESAIPEADHVSETVESRLEELGYK